MGVLNRFMSRLEIKEGESQQNNGSRREKGTNRGSKYRLEIGSGGAFEREYCNIGRAGQGRGSSQPTLKSLLLFINISIMTPK